MKRRFHLPKKITLPCGFVIRIEESVMTSADYAEYDYSSEGGVIRLRLGMTKKQQKYYLSHELIHVVNDYHHLMVLEGGLP